MSNCVGMTWSLHLLSCCCISVVTILSVSSCSLGKELSYKEMEEVKVKKMALTPSNVAYMTDTHLYLVDTLIQGGD